MCSDLQESLADRSNLSNGPILGAVLVRAICGLAAPHLPIILERGSGSI